MHESHQLSADAPTQSVAVLLVVYFFRAACDAIMMMWTTFSGSATLAMRMRFYYYSYSPFFFASLRSRTDASSWVTCINITPNCRREKKVFSREIKQHEKSSAFENINCTFNYAYGGPDCTWRCLRMHTATYEEKTVWSLFRSATTQSAARYDLRSFFSTAPSSRGELN